MSSTQGWFETDGDYRDRTAQEANERTIEESTSSAPSQGWLEDDDDYRDRIAQEASERTIEDATGSAPSQGWLEADDDYRDRITQEADERRVEDSTGSVPSQGWFEDEEDYDIRIRKEANEHIIEDDDGDAPRQGLFECDHDYRSRIAHEAREIRAREPSDSSTDNNRGSSSCSSGGGSGGGGLIVLIIIGAIVVFAVTSLRPKSLGTIEPVFASNDGGDRLSFEGRSSYRINDEDKTATIHSDKINNTRKGGHSGSIRLLLYATERPYNGGAISGRVLFSEILDPLNGGWSYSNIDKTGKLEGELTPGTSYFLTLVLLERQGGNDYIMSSASFPEPERR